MTEPRPDDAVFSLDNVFGKLRNFRSDGVSKFGLYQFRDFYQFNVEKLPGWEVVLERYDDGPD